MFLNLTLAALALLSLALTVWQWLVARRFPLHRRGAASASSSDSGRSRREQRLAGSPQAPAAPQPAVTLLKPLKGCDAATEDCLRSWFTQDYAGPVQILFGVADAEDPVCGVVRKLLQDFPQRDARLVVCGPLLGANAKVSKLVELEQLAKHDLLIISDADVRVPPDCLANVVAPLQQPEAGLVNCFYRLANPTTLAMQWEAIAINADFWSQVLQARSLRPIDFALGAVMALRRAQLTEIGGFRALADCLADDYQLGNRIAQRGYCIALSPVVVECWSAPMGWSEVWKHQLRWARTIRVCQPAPYFFSVLSNATLWPLLWLLSTPSTLVLAVAFGCVLTRVLTALNLEHRLTGPRPPFAHCWLVPVKDLLQAVIWLLAFLGNRIEWRGHRMRLRRNGTLVRG
ncbi:MAG TPA: bacteriohopanetetrol glucosamine biosynthesis glycosyltransferase HpnI [Candidatus Paceibacterota bacterium]|nr:bacteriohopanetetrol glucosamine biosynthesis glycosyltransferase HpnI [Verrucomicrobiota bacterium]HSA09412.1 bacteriohopanetetrol glucosamine biosynthesis glycosyltransferase HpnI [Candidatus Paceibacterota bacterium]